jgi:hypothetical protein
MERLSPARRINTDEPKGLKQETYRSSALLNLPPDIMYTIYPWVVLSRHIRVNRLQAPMLGDAAPFLVHIACGSSPRGG